MKIIHIKNSGGATKVILQKEICSSDCFYSERKAVES